MKRKSIVLIIGLMSVALMGVLAMQWYFINQSYQLKSQLFDQNVNESLNQVVAKLEKQDAYNFLLKKAAVPAPVKTQTLPKLKPVYRWVSRNKKNSVESYANYLKKQQVKADSLFNVRDSLIRSKYPLVLAYEGNENNSDQTDQVENFQVDVLQVEDALGRVYQQAITRPVPRLNIQKTFNAKALRQDSVRQYIVFDPQNGPRIITLARPKLVDIHQKTADAKGLKHREIKVVKQFLDSVQGQKTDAIEDLALELKQVAIPLKKRIQPLLLDSLIRSELRNKGINMEYAYQVSQSNTDSVIFRKAANPIPFLAENTYKTQLFPKDMLRESGWLSISFPNKNKAILANMNFILGLSGGLLLVLLFSFGYTLQMILRQKKISEMKTDFINNMTHEFKTPVATIMIASEALKDHELRKDDSRIDRLAGIIYDENVRLGNHIERVLNLAKIDKEDFKLEQKEIAVNDLLAAVADSMSLQIQKNGAEIKLELNASKDAVLGDELHLSNVFFNLLDNALKYCQSNPLIELSTANTGKNLIIKVKDNGIGMSRDQLSKIFDQFYRIPTGNVHNVKGFGLGLSYVNTIIKSLKGQVRVKSEKDKGSEFEISIPLA